MARKRGPTWQPSSDDIKQIIFDQNPWFRTSKVPEIFAPKVERPLAQALWAGLKKDRPHRFQIVLGPRRVGKTTCLYQTVRHLLRQGIDPFRIWWMRLDHPLLMQMGVDQLVQSVLRSSHATLENPVYLFLDELAYAQKWDLWLKSFFDDKLPIRIAASSSSTAVLRERGLESGVGRWEEVNLSPYLFPEYLDLLQIHPPIVVEESFAKTLETMVEKPFVVEGLREHLLRFLFTGGFPELLLLDSGPGEEREEDRILHSQRTLRSDAVDRAVYKDIPQAFQIDNPMLLERMLYTLAGQITEVLSPVDICQTLDGLSQPTFDRYLSYLIRSFLVFTLPNYSGSEGTKQKRGRKLFFVDGAVRNAALQRGTAPLSDPQEMGLLLENLAAGHLHALGVQSHVRIYHWRDKKNEVDLVYDHPQEPLAFEIGRSSSHDRSGLIQFQAKFPRFRHRCFIVSPHAAPVNPKESRDGVGTLSLEWFLLAVGRQAAQGLSSRFE